MQTVKYILFIFSFMFLASCEPTTVLDLNNQAQTGFGIFSYPLTQASYMLGDEITPIEATLIDSGTFVFSVEPELPIGITVDPITGTISGSALIVTPKQTYTFKANLDGIGVEYNHNITIEITQSAPTNFSYPSNDLNLTFATPFIPITPIVTGVVDSFSVDPPLPIGLNFSSLTGEISGVPLVNNYEAIHIVTATNSGGGTKFPLTIRVLPQPPTLVFYNSSDYDCDAGNSCFIPAPVTVPLGAANLSFSISPELPEGYNFNTSTGEISLLFGERLIPSPNTTYTVTVFNEGGSTTTDFDLETVVQPISSLNYLSTVNLNKDIHAPISLFANITPFFTPVTQYEVISNNLPSGLILNNQTGEITGVTTQAPGLYTVNIAATNQAGSIAQSINFNITEISITNLAHTQPVNFYLLGQEISIPRDIITNQPIIPYTHDGSSILFFTFEHFDENGISLGEQLPSGLTWNNASGVISGTPAELITNHTLRVFAHNGQGASSNFVDLPLNISEPAPTFVNYENGTNDNSFTPSSCSDFDISPIIISGGNPTEFTINPPLGTPGNFPEIPGTSLGLSFDSLTGRIFGNISEHYNSPRNYLITASNPAGSVSFLLTITTSPDSPLFTIENLSAERGISSLVSANFSSCSQEAIPQITPDLPSEFSLTANSEISYSGIITGPIESPSLIANQSYELTLSNTGGSQSQNLDIELRYRLAGTNNNSVPIITDFDNDLSPDIALVQSFCTTATNCFNSRFTLLKALNSNEEYTEVFTQVLEREYASAPAIFDLDQDGFKDLIYHDPNGGFSIGGQIVIQLQDTNTTPISLGTTHQSLNLLSIPRSIHYKDINTDSVPDIIIAADSQILIFFSNTTLNQYDPTPIALTVSNFTGLIEEIALADINSDSVLDMILLNKDNNSLCTLIANSDISAPPTNTAQYPSACSQNLDLSLATGVQAQEIYAGNINNDNKDDLVIVTQDTHTTLITIPNNGDSFSTFSPTTQQTSSHTLNSNLVFSDITGSSNQDIIYWGGGVLSVLDGDALSNASISPIEKPLNGVTNLGAGLLNGNQGSLMSCTNISAIGSCAIDYSSLNRL